jgi:hypothetical protein
MSRHSVTHFKAGTASTANVIMWQLRAVSTQRIWLYELALSVAIAPNTSGPRWALNRPTATGTSTATVVPQAEDPDVPAAVSLLDTTWSANPTLGSVDLRNYTTPNAIGSGIVWTWYDQPFVIPKSGGLCIVNRNNPGTSRPEVTTFTPSLVSNQWQPA